MALYFGQQHPGTVYRTGVWVCVVLVLSVISCSCCYFLDFIMIFIMIVVTIIGIFMAINYFLNYTLGLLYLNMVLVLQMHNSLDVSAPGHSLWILDWTCFLWTPLWHIYIPYKDILQGVPGFATDCPCGVWCLGLTTWLLFFWSTFWKSSLKWL